jgi:uncharacterized protein HemX
MTTGKPAIISAHVETVQAPQDAPAEEPTLEHEQPAPSPETTTTSEEAKENEEEQEEDSGSEAEQEQEEEEKGKTETSTANSFSAMGASFVAVAGLGSLLVYFLRKKNKKTDVEQYKPVRGED